MKFTTATEFIDYLRDTGIPIDDRMYVEASEAKQLVPLLNSTADPKSSCPYFDTLIQGQSNMSDAQQRKFDRLVAATLGDIGIDDLIELRDLIRAAVIDNTRDQLVAYANRTGYVVEYSDDMPSDLAEWVDDDFRARAFAKVG